MHLLPYPRIVQPDPFRAYYQTHFFDGAFPVPPQNDQEPPNKNYPFSFVDDMAELVFKDAAHLKNVMTSEYVKTVIGPDGLNFNDFSSANAIFATVERRVHGDSAINDSATTADYFVLVSGSPESGIDHAEQLSSLLIKSVESVGDGQIYRIDMTIRLPDPAGILKYFGAGDPSKPAYTLVFKMYMQAASSVSAVRKVQKDFEDLAGDIVDSAFSTILFGKRGLILDQARQIKFDGSRQPVLFQ